MDEHRANSAWLMMTFPAEVKAQDVDNVFFGAVTTHRYCDVREAGDRHDILHVADGILCDYAKSVHSDAHAAALPLPLLHEIAVGPTPTEVAAVCRMNDSILMQPTDI